MTEPKSGEIYRHYKRQAEYRIICTAVIEATLTPCVVYEALDPAADHQYWVRPMNDFCAEVELAGTLVPRFQRV